MVMVMMIMMMKCLKIKKLIKSNTVNENHVKQFLRIILCLDMPVI